MAVNEPSLRAKYVTVIARVPGIYGSKQTKFEGEVCNVQLYISSDWS